MKKLSALLGILILLLSSTDVVKAQSADLKRRADLGIRFRKMNDSPGAIVTQVSSGGPAEKCGIRKDDQVVSINGIALPDEYTLAREVRKLRGGEPVRLMILRSGSSASQLFQFTPVGMPFETFENLTVEPMQLTNDFGDRLRAFVTKPKQRSGKLPAILFVSWLSCSSVELNDLSDTWTMMLRDVAEKTGALLMRVEKPGVGDSEGIACADCDLNRELNSYQAALHYLKSRPDVDTTRLVIFGGSLGGTLAPIVGKGHTIKAYVSGVSVYKTWLEHMIELERRRLLLFGKSQDEVTSLMQGYIEFHTAYLTQFKTPQQVTIEKPHLASLWYDQPEHQYGRPARFYHQVQQQNFFENWGKVKVPVLVVAGEYDWIMTFDDSKLLAEHLNAKNPGQATRIIGKGMDHHWAKYNNAQEAFQEVNGTYDAETVSAMIAWIKKVIQ
jgi:dienelactone hydrolase